VGNLKAIAQKLVFNSVFKSLAPSGRPTAANLERVDRLICCKRHFDASGIKWKEDYIKFMLFIIVVSNERDTKLRLNRDALPMYE
jgi:hypothetical protein